MPFTRCGMAFAARAPATRSRSSCTVAGSCRGSLGRARALVSMRGWATGRDGVLAHALRAPRRPAPPPALREIARTPSLPVAHPGGMVQVPDVERRPDRVVADELTADDVARLRAATGGPS